MSRTTQTVPVLTYHSLNVLQNSYAQNDHLAFAADLRLIDAMGLQIVPLERVVDWVLGALPDSAVENAVALTLDDGSWLDFHDIEHPTCGTQRGMMRLLREYRDELPPGRQPDLHVSSFVIASPQARTELDEKNLIGQGWWGDDWWSAAQRSGLMSIECHSWDHVHDTLDHVAQRDNLKGDFREVNTYDDCAAQVTQAARYIESLAGRRPVFYAYPWGQASRYMVEEFMPTERPSHRFRAAFSIDPRHVRAGDNRWFLPRYVCGRDWKAPAELEAILGG